MRFLKRQIGSVILFPFIVLSAIPPVAASPMPWMPQPGIMVSVTPLFTPSFLTGMTIYPNEPFKFSFLIQQGDANLSDDEKQTEYSKLIKYFLAALAVPDTDQWVNLSPYEQERIIPDNFGMTEMGRDLLAQDYLLKQISSSLTNPDTGLGKKFWDKVYEQAYEKFGTTDIPTDTFNKVWITPDKAVVYEKGNMVYVLEHRLKVMMDKDYRATKINESLDATAEENEAVVISQRVMKEIIIPEIEKEVNEGKNFAPLRQVYSGMLLATWYKLALKESVLGKLYADKSKVKGIDQDPASNQEIYEKYTEAFRKGVFNMIREDVDIFTQEVIPRKYFSGGFDRSDNAQLEIRKDLDYSQTGYISDNLAVVDMATVSLQRTPKPVGAATQRNGKNVQKRDLEWKVIIEEILSKVIVRGKKNYFFRFFEGQDAGIKIKLTAQEREEWGRLNEADNLFLLQSFLEARGISALGFETLATRGMSSEESKAFKRRLYFDSKIVEIAEKSFLVNPGNNAKSIILSSEAGLQDQARDLIRGLTKNGIENWNIFYAKVDPVLNLYREGVLKPGSAYFAMKDDFLSVLNPPSGVGNKLFSKSGQGVFDTKRFSVALMSLSKELNSADASILKGLVDDLVDFLGSSPRNMGIILKEIIESDNDAVIREYLRDRESPVQLDRYALSNRGASDAVYVLLKGVFFEPLINGKRPVRVRSDQEAREILAYVQNVINTVVEMKSDAVVIPETSSRDVPGVETKDTTGGIDLAQSNLDMQIKRDGAGIILPVSQQDLDSIRIDGLVPVILDIKPAAGMIVFN